MKLPLMLIMGMEDFFLQTSAGVTYKNLRWLAGNYPDSQSALFNQSLVIFRRLKQTLREALSCPSQVTKFKKYQYQIFSPWAEIHKSVLEKCQIETICSTDTKAIHKGDNKTWFCFCLSVPVCFTGASLDVGSHTPRIFCIHLIVIMIIWFALWFGSSSVSRCSVLIQQHEHRSVENKLN